MFGYSATVGIRVAGQGNITFSQLTAAVLLLGGLAVWRRPGRVTVYAVIAMLAVTLLVMAAPPFGGDFGAAIAGAPGFGLFAWLLLGTTIRLRTVVILGVVLVVAGLLVGFADYLRPRDQQTHVGRFFDELLNGASGDSFLTIRRKIDANLGVVRRHASCCGSCRSSRSWSGTSGGCTVGGSGRCTARCRSSARPCSRSRWSRCSATRSTTPASRSPR